jgi:hypothetical protein
MPAPPLTSRSLCALDESASNAPSQRRIFIAIRPAPGAHLLGESLSMDLDQTKKTAAIPTV